MANSGGKSKFITYILWLIGGVFGLHHFYLGRDLQGLIWYCTLGGYFGCGWFSDIFRISEYVDQANQDKDFVKKLKYTQKKNKTPPSSSLRFCGMVVVAYVLSTVLSLAIPEEEIFGYSFKRLHYLVPFACALGVWSVGNIGVQEGGIIYPAVVAYVTYPLASYVTDESSAFFIMVLASAWTFDAFEKRWSANTKPQKSLFKRCLIIGVCCLLYASLWGSYLYFNATVTDADGDEIPLREMLHHFLKSPWWLDVKQSLIDVWNFAQEHGWMEIWRQIIELSDPTGEQNAFKVLELSTDAAQNEINSKCRTLSVKYHPDKVKDEKLKSEAQERFYEIQQACELLSNSRAKRKRRNKKFEL